ncbi:MAG: hypothetical protein AAB358_02150 [Patescibacteria group bacterium]
MDQNFLSRIEEDINYAKATEHLVKEEKEELRKLLEENLKYNRAIYADTQKIRSFMFWRIVISIIWLVVIVAPIIAAFIWLPPLVKDLFGNYQDLFGQANGIFDFINQLKQLK